MKVVEIKIVEVTHRLWNTVCFSLLIPYHTFYWIIIRPGLTGKLYIDAPIMIFVLWYLYVRMVDHISSKLHMSIANLVLKDRAGKLRWFMQQKHTL